MRKWFLWASLLSATVLVAATGAQAADLGGRLPVYSAPQQQVMPEYTFAGWYFGATLGYGNADIDLSAPTGAFDFDADGVVGGGLAGYNWQRGNIVIGVEGEGLATDFQGNQNFGAATARPDFDFMASLRARAGYLITPQLMIFATLGGAYLNADLPVTGPGGAGRNEDFFGYQVGGGAELALSNKWSARFDYQFTDVGSESVQYPGGTLNFDPDVSTVKGSLNYHF